MTRQTAGAYIGPILRSLRERLGYSQESLAEIARIHRTYIGGVERGERNPSIATLDRILKALGVTWKQFGEALDRGLKRAKH